jgi:hypothetical protein
MKSKYFHLKGIKEPGKVDLYKRGTVLLSELSDDELYKLYNEGCIFLGLTPDGFKKYVPDTKKIKPKSIKLSKDNTPKSLG